MSNGLKVTFLGARFLLRLEYTMKFHPGIHSVCDHNAILVHIFLFKKHF